MSRSPIRPDPEQTVAAESQDRRAWIRPVLAVAAGAILLRLLLLLGRGDYLAFDEGWYLLLARSIYSGDGYSLIGIPHVTLSPLFPLLAGAVGVLVDSWVWGGRIVAALASGLLVVPAWFVFSHLAPRRTAFIAVLLVAVLPALAPFVVPFWIGADLWVGAEPLLHLFLFTGIACWLRADRTSGFGAWGAAGAAFGLAFLARPEAILTWGVLGLATLVAAALDRSPRRLSGAALMGLAFVVVASPYWLYVHDVTGRWSLTGRGVAPVSTTVTGLATHGRAGPAADIERMLWTRDTSYQERLYALDPSGLRLRSAYWGVHPDPAPRPDHPHPPAQPAAEAGDHGVGRDGIEVRPSAAALYVQALRSIIPLFVLPFVALGLLRRRTWSVRREASVAGALVGTSLSVAYMVAVDPRTQLFLLPLFCLYAAHGFAVVDDVVRRRLQALDLQPRFLESVLVGAALFWMLGIHAQRLYVSRAYGSPHHVVAAQNRSVGEALGALAPDRTGPVASWHPAIAVFANRDWRVLPFATLPEIIRYAQATDVDVMVLSAYYPPDLGVENLDTRYLLLPVPEPVEGADSWTLEIAQADSIRAVGVLEPRAPESR